MVDISSTFPAEKELEDSLVFPTLALLAGQTTYFGDDDYLASFLGLAEGPLEEATTS
jgi:hypothetical protein